MKMLELLQQALEQVAGRFRQVRLWGGLAVCWLAWALVGLAAWAFLFPPAPATGWGVVVGSFAFLAVATGLAWVFVALRTGNDPLRLARRIEARYPDLSSGLVTAVEQMPAASNGRLGFLQAAVIDNALRHGRTHDWEATVPPRRLYAAHLAHVVALTALAVVVTTMAASLTPSRDPASPSLAEVVGAGEVRPTEVQVEPGHSEIERGTPLLVVARFEGPVPASVTLVVEGGEGAGSEQAMTRSLEDPTFAGQVRSVQADLSYHVAFADRRSETYRVKVFEYPEVQRVDARLVFPAFAQAEPKTVEDVRYVTAVEGTELTLSVHLNKEVARAQLVDEMDQAIPLTPAGKGELYSATLTVSDRRRFRVELMDREGRKNKRPAEVEVNATRNKPPIVKATFPGRDVRVSTLEELGLKAEAKDDFGVVRSGLSYMRPGEELREIVLQEANPAPKEAKLEHLLALEALRAQPDELITYFFWAEDLGVDGKPRRTSGDMYFAEVRHFEEIFRQGERDPNQEERERQQREQQQQQQGEGSPAERADQLAELQKQIINGTWKLMRREIEAKPTAQFVPDSKVLREAQQKVLEQAGQLGEQLEDPESAESLGRALEFMKEAEKRLGEAEEKSEIGALQPALAAEQAAYQALLKLRAREFEVQRNNQRSQQGQRSSRSASRNSRSPTQSQLRQLELSGEMNRYETQRAAQDQREAQAQADRARQEREQRENQEMADRLRELARRQTDLNDRVKELQSALEQAQTRQEREELQRQLKRLRDQQRQVLRDADELRDRMEREENRDRLAETRQQLEQSRERIRQASEALEEGRLSQAITEGTRAGRELNQLREGLRRQTADRFGEEMRDLREKARELDEGQKELTRRLAELEKNPPKNLRDTGKEEIKEGLKEQRASFDRILDRMQRTVGEAQESEPRLAQELFDTFRGAKEEKVDDALNLAERLTEAGVPGEAADASRRAGEGIGRLRQGIDRAAENVLGGETDSLRRVQQALDDLAEQIDREIARGMGREAGERRPGEREGQPGERGREGQPGERGGREGQPGERAGREGQPGERGGREGQPGDREGRPGEAREPGARGGREGQPGERPGREGQPGEGRQPGERGGREGQPGERGGRGGRPGEPGDRERQPGEGGGREGQPGERGDPEGQPGGVRQPGERGERERQPGERGGRQGQPGERPGERGGRPGDLDRLIEAGSGGRSGGPIRGGGFREWYDRMRSAEELIEDPELRAEAARIRDRVRGEREEFKRHAREPDWKKLQELVADPLNELRSRIAEELRKRESPDALVPIDRDPVPPEFAEGVRRYYERLGRKSP